MLLLLCGAGLTLEEMLQQPRRTQQQSGAQAVAEGHTGPHAGPGGPSGMELFAVKLAALSACCTTLHYTTCKHITPALPPHLVPPAAGAESLSIELNNKSSSPVSKSSSPASKGSSPLAVQLHQAASPKHVHGNSGGDAGRQGRRRRTLPPPSFVESLERLAALHRWAKQPQRWDAALVPPLMRLHASMRCPPQQSHHLLHCLVLVCVQGPQ